MIKKTFHFSCLFLLEAIAVILVGIIIIVGGLIYKISVSPMNVSFLNRYMQDSIHNINSDININPTEVYLSFDSGKFVLSFDSVQVSLSEDNASRIDDLKIGFSFASLVKGMPEFIEADKINSLVYLKSNGEVDFKVTSNDESISISKSIKDVLKNEKFMTLKRISLQDVNLFVRNEITGDSQSFKDIDIDFQREDNGDINGQTNIDYEGNVFKLETFYEFATENTGVTLKFEKLNISNLYNKYNFIKNLNIIADGSVFVFLGDDLKIDYVELSGNINNNSTFYIPSLFEDKLPVKGNFDVIYKDNVIESKSININIAGIDFSDDLKMEIADVINLDTKINIDNLSLEKAKTVWPKDLALGAKDWVLSRLSNGNIDKAQIEIAGDFNKETSEYNLDKLQGFIDFSNMTVNYLDTMSNVEDAKGRANFDLSKFDIDIDEGHINDAHVKDNSEVIIPFNEELPIEVNINLAGNVQTVAKVINDKPLHYMDKINISPNNINGNIDGRLELDIFDYGKDIEVKVNANLSDIAVKQLIWKQNLENASGTLSVTNDKVVVNMQGAFEDQKARANVKWEEFFKAGSEYDSIAHIDGVMKIDLLKELNIVDLTSLFSSEVPATAVYTSKNRVASVDIKSNLKGATLKLPLFPYNKTKNEEADLSLKINLKNGQFRDIQDITLKDDNLLLQGWYRSSILYMSNFEMPKNNIKLSGFYDYKGENIVPSVDISGNIGGKSSLKILDRNGKNTVNLETENLGDTLRSLEIWNDLYNGKLSLSGESEENPSILRGRLIVNDFQVKDTNILGTILASMSLDGLISSLNGEGIKFNKMASDFAWDYNKNQISFKNGKSSGSSLGITFDNIVDIKNNTIAMKGTIAMMQGLSNVLKEIPILGTVLTGTDSEGLIGSHYSVKGSLDNPKIDVNAISTFTPGILRDIFFSGEDLEKTIDKENKKKEEKPSLDEIRGVKN